MSPDYEVEITPRDWVGGRDSQLEKAVALVLDSIQNNPGLHGGRRFRIIIRRNSRAKALPRDRPHRPLSIAKTPLRNNRKKDSMQTVTLEDVSPKLAEHLTGIPGSEWAFWRWACLRTAGFPATGVLRLTASQAVVKAADAVLESEQALNNAWSNACQQANDALDELRRLGQWEDKKRRVAMLRARDKLKSRDLPKSSPEIEPLTTIAHVHAALQDLQTARSAFDQRFSTCSAETSQVIREAVSEPRFREAVIWQNRAAVYTAFDSLARRSAGDRSRGSRQRQHEELVASYIQRYSLKNDTIGFFGPVGWARFVPDGRPVTLKPGQTLLATRKVYFEYWPIDALASVIAKDQLIYPWLRPMAMPFLRVEGLVLQHPIYGPMRLMPGQAALIKMCSGKLTAKQIAQRFMNLPGAAIKSESDFYKVLAELAAKQVISWGFNIPLNAHPELALRQTLEGIPDENARQKGLGMLEQLETARAVVEASVGDPEKLDAAFGELGAVFTRLTNVSATRNQGQTYGGRTSVYEDCRRDVEVRLGPEFMRALAEPLSLLLTGARWLTSEVARVYKQKFADVYDDLVRTTGEHSVDASLFWTRVMPDLMDGHGDAWEKLMKQFQAKWDRILAPDPGLREMKFSCEELRPRVQQEFAAPTAGWKFGRYHSPDIMIVASSQEAIAQGEYTLVLGELHVGGNTLKPWLFLKQHPSPEDLIRAVEIDIGKPKLIPIPPKREGELLARTAGALISPDDIYLEYATDSFAPDRSRALTVSSLVIERRDGELIAITRDGQYQFDAMELVGGRFSDMVQDTFKMLPPRPHTPRISIDRLVIKRETWRFPPSDLAFAGEKDSGARFLQARAWARARGVPRCVFFKVPVEKKPSYLDFDSPILVDMFSKMVRRTQDADVPSPCIDMTEMLPSAEQLWVTDAEDNRYTSELRIVAVDQTRVAGPDPFMRILTSSIAATGD